MPPKKQNRRKQASHGGGGGRDKGGDNNTDTDTATITATASGIQLAQPDRSGPSGDTLIDMAGERDLFKQAEIRQRQLRRGKKKVELSSSSSDNDGNDDSDSDNDGDDEDDDEDDDGNISPRAERILDTVLWTVSLCTLHFTLDVLVQNQYAVEIVWPDVVKRSALAFPVFCLLFHNLHEHPSDPRLLPGLPTRFQRPLRQFIFSLTCIFCGCYAIHISNVYGYVAVMKQAPPIGCLWIWSAIEMDLILGVISLSINAAFMWVMGYGF